MAKKATRKWATVTNDEVESMAEKVKEQLNPALEKAEVKTVSRRKKK